MQAHDNIEQPIPYRLTESGSRAPLERRVAILEAALERAKRFARTAADDAISLFVEYQYDGYEGVDAHNAALRELDGALESFESQAEAEYDEAVAQGDDAPEVHRG